MVEGLINVLQTTGNDNKATVIKMETATIQYTQMLPQLMQEMQQMHTQMAYIHNELNNTNKMLEMTTMLVVATRATRSHFGDNSTSGLVVHTIIRGVVVTPRQKAVKKM